MSIVKMMLNRKFSSGREIIPLVKYCFLFRKLIEIAGRLGADRCLTFYR